MPTAERQLRPDQRRGRRWRRRRQRWRWRRRRRWRLDQRIAEVVAEQRTDYRAADSRGPHRGTAFLVEYVISAAADRIGDAEPNPGSCRTAQYCASDCASVPTPWLLHVGAPRDQRQGRYSD